MSHDRTVVILRTKGRKGYGVEYRVATVATRENMFEDADYPSRDNPRIDRAWTLGTFTEPMVMCAETAMMEAIRKKKEWDENPRTFSEIDIVVIDLPDIFFPAAIKRPTFTERSRQQVAGFGAGKG